MNAVHKAKRVTLGSTVSYERIPSDQTSLQRRWILSCPYRESLAGPKTVRLPSLEPAVLFKRFKEVLMFFYFSDLRTAFTEHHLLTWIFSLYNIYLHSHTVYMKAMITVFSAVVTMTMNDAKSMEHDHVCGGNLYLRVKRYS